MLKDLKQTTKHTSVYALGNIATKLIGIFLVPLYTNIDYLSHDEYGALAVLEATSQLLIGLLTMAMLQSLTRWYWDQKYEGEQKGIFFTTLAFLLMILTPVVCLITALSGQISSLTLGTTDFSYLFKLVSISAAVTIINNQILCLAKLKSKSLIYTLVQIVKLTFTLLLIIWGIVKKGKGLDAIWEATLIGEIAALLLLLPFVIKNIEFKFHYKILKEMLIYGIPLMVAAMSSVILATADRYMLSSMSSLENTGVYSLGYRIANTLKVVVTGSLALAISPLNMKKMNEPSNQRFYSKINTYTSFLFMLALIGLSLFSLEIIKVFTGSKIYWEANLIVPLISYALFFGLMKDNILIGLQIKKKTKIIGSLILITSLLNIGLNLLLIPVWDIYGAALATLISQIAFFSLITYYSQKAYSIPYEWRKIVVMVVVSFVIIFVGNIIAETNVIIRLLIKGALFCSFPFILYCFSFYEDVEVENIKQIFQNWKNPKKFGKNIKQLIH